MQVSNIKSFIDECNWKGINHPISRICVDRDVRTIKDVEEYTAIHKSIRQEYLSKHYFDISIKQELAKE